MHDSDRQMLLAHGIYSVHVYVLFFTELTKLFLATAMIVHAHLIYFKAAEFN